MADSFSSLLRLRLQQTGANENTWGQYLNSAALQLVEDAIAGTAEITVAGSDVTLTTQNGANDQSRSAILSLVGSPGAARNIIVPTLSKIYLVTNGTGHTMTIKTSASGANTVAVSNGVTTLVTVNGDGDVTEVSPQASSFASNAAALGGVAAANYARLDNRQTFDKGQMLTPVALTMGATVTPNMELGNIFVGALTTNTDFAPPTSVSANAAQPFQMVIRQAAAGGPYSVTFDAFYDFLGAVPAMSSVASSVLYVRGVIIPSLGKAICVANVQSESTIQDMVLSVNEKNVDVFRRLGSPAGVVNVTITVDEGVVISSDSTDVPAMDFSGGFASGSTINLVNLGYIIGKGGGGGNSQISFDTGGTDPLSFGQQSVGLPGGPAMRAPGAGITFNITNASGRIWGGGGGGGSGGATVSTNDDVAIGGAGGGGAGCGAGGQAGIFKIDTATTYTSTAGSNGVLGLDGTDAGGAGAAGAGSGGALYGTGGDGGDFGASGATGANGAGSVGLPGASGGAAGKAIDLTGASPTFVNGSGSPNVKGSVS
jgi:hypothetical protein